MGLKMEEVMEKLKMELDAQKNFAQVYEDGKMNKRIGGEMMKLDPIIIQESRKEIRAGETQPSLKIWKKSNNLARIFIRTGVTKCWTSLDH